MTKTVVNVSGGNGSAIALLRCVERFGAASVDAIFADTRTEHPDLYRFLDDLERVAGVPITRLSDGRDIWRVFDDEGIITTPGTARACKASIELKQVQLARHIGTRYAPAQCQIAVGLSWMEPERQKRLSAKLAPYKVIFPLDWQPCLSACAEQEYLRKRGLRLSALYDMGYPHNNCHGLCVLAGLKQWAGVLKDFPVKYVEAEAWEQRFIERHDFTINKDRRGGETKNYSLCQLREDVEAGRAFDDGWRGACNCMALERDDGPQTSIFKLLEAKERT